MQIFANIAFAGLPWRHLAVFFKKVWTVTKPQHLPTQRHIYHQYVHSLCQVASCELHMGVVAISRQRPFCMTSSQKSVGGRECPPKFFWHSMWSLTLISNNILPTQTCTQKWCQPLDQVGQEQFDRTSLLVCAWPLAQSGHEGSCVRFQRFKLISYMLLFNNIKKQIDKINEEYIKTFHYCHAYHKKILL